MKRALFLVMLIVFALGAQAEPRVQVVATDPGTNATLGRDEPFYVRIEFATDQPIKIWAHPYFRGKPVQRTKTNPSLEYTGAGYALGWFSLDGAENVDEMRIKLGGGKPYREWFAASYPVRLAGTGRPAAQRSRPEWVDGLLREERERYQQAYKERMNKPASAGDTAFMWVFMLLVVGLLAAGLGAPLWGVWNWRGVWRVAAAVPAVIMVVVVLRILIDTARDPTSHNLWPFEILMWGGASAVAMGVLALFKKFVQRR